MDVEETLRFQTQLQLLIAQYPEAELFVRAEVRFAMSNPDLAISVPEGRTEIREVVIELPMISKIILLVAIRDDRIVFFDIR